MTKIADILGLLFVLPLVFGAALFAATAFHQSPETNAETATGLIQDAVTPWWLGLAQSLVGIPILGVLFFICLGLGIRYGILPSS